MNVNNFIALGCSNYYDNYFDVIACSSKTKKKKKVYLFNSNSKSQSSCLNVSMSNT